MTNKERLLHDFHELYFKDPDKRKAELLLKYSKKNVHSFVQLDGWTGEDHAFMTEADKDRDFFAVDPFAEELRSSPKELAVRIQIHVGTKKKDAIRLINKMLELIEDDHFDEELNHVDDMAEQEEFESKVYSLLNYVIKQAGYEMLEVKRLKEIIYQAKDMGITEKNILIETWRDEDLEL